MSLESAEYRSLTALGLLRSRKGIALEAARFAAMLG